MQQQLQATNEQRKMGDGSRSRLTPRLQVVRARNEEEASQRRTRRTFKMLQSSRLQIYCMLRHLNHSVFCPLHSYSSSSFSLSSSSSSSCSIKCCTASLSLSLSLSLPLSLSLLSLPLFLPLSLALSRVFEQSD
jgi:hypothetical protein